MVVAASKNIQRRGNHRHGRRTEFRLLALVHRLRIIVSAIRGLLSFDGSYTTGVIHAYGVEMNTRDARCSPIRQCYSTNLGQSPYCLPRICTGARSRTDGRNNELVGNSLGSFS